MPLYSKNQAIQFIIIVFYNGTNGSKRWYKIYLGLSTRVLL